MDKLGKNYYIHKPERLVVKYPFHYESAEDYDKNLAILLENACLTADKLVRIERMSDGYDILHFYADGGIEQYAMVKFEPNREVSDEEIFKKGQVFVFMGEIPNMPGHACLRTTTPAGFTAGTT